MILYRSYCRLSVPSIDDLDPVVFRTCHIMKSNFQIYSVKMHMKIKKNSGFYTVVLNLVCAISPERQTEPVKDALVATNLQGIK